MNVLLTRCKRGLVIVSNESFLRRGKGSDTLLGKLVAHWQLHYPQRAWIDYRFVADASADLPGAVNMKALSLKARLPTIYSVTMKHTPSPTPQSVSFSSKQPGFQTKQARNHIDVTSFPPILSKQPLLGGSWNASLFQDLHPFSHIRHRRRQLPPDDTTTTISPSPQICQWPNVGSANAKRQPQAEPRSWPVADPKTSKQRPFIHNIRKKTNVPTTRTNLASDHLRPKHFEPLQISSNPVRPQLRAGFIRSITVHSRNPPVLLSSNHWICERELKLL